jgi:hypothetical protein
MPPDFGPDSGGDKEYRIEVAIVDFSPWPQGKQARSFVPWRRGEYAQFAYVVVVRSTANHKADSLPLRPDMPGSLATKSCDEFG